MNAVACNIHISGRNIINVKKKYFMEMVNLEGKQGWANVLKLILPYFFIVGTFQLIGFYYAGLDIDNYEEIRRTPIQDFIVKFSTFIGTLTVIGLFIRFVDKMPFSSLGFEKGDIWKDILKGLALGFIIMLIGFTVLITTKQIEFVNTNFKLSSFFLSLTIYVFVAIYEEILMRGYILKNLMFSFNNYIALIISSVIFSLLHAGNPNVNLFSLFELFIAGILLGLPYILTKKLWFSIALHFSWNFCQGTIFGFNVSGQEHYTIIETKFSVATIWNGGDFGFEGSILSFFLQILAIVLIYYSFRTENATIKI
jgi:membrane protease YdiL (CAAX protease family)